MSGTVTRLRTPVIPGPIDPDDAVRCYPVWSRDPKRVTVATLLGIGRDKAYRLVDSRRPGGLRAVLVGGEMRVRHTDLTAWLDSRPVADPGT